MLEVWFEEDGVFTIYDPDTMGQCYRMPYNDLLDFLRSLGETYSSGQPELIPGWFVTSNPNKYT